MAFLYSAIGDNTPENREWLEKVGYWVYGLNNEKYLNSYTNQNEQGIAIGWDLNDFPKNTVNCIGNPQLFQAVTAMRDDSDYMQWFYNQYYNEWSICEQENMFDYFNLDWCAHARKATKDEIIKRFTNDENMQ